MKLNQLRHQTSPLPRKLFTAHFLRLNKDRGGFINYVVSLPSIQPIWEAHTRHPFVLGLGSGTLPIDNFKYYLIQDYLFLNHYARVICAGAAKAPALADVFAQAEYALSVRDELKMHLFYCSEHFGLKEADMAATPEHPACRNYTDFVREVGEREDWLALQVALVPCMYGYKIVGEYLYEWEGSVKGTANSYWGWVEQYAGQESVDAVTKSTELVEKYVARQTPQRIEELVSIFKKAAEVRYPYH